MLTAVVASKVQLSAPETFEAGPPSLAYSELEAAALVQTADGNQGIVLSLSIRERLRHGLPGLLPSLALTGRHNTGSTPAVTDASGQSHMSLATTLAQSQNMLATAGGLSFVNTLRFVPGPI